MNANLFGGIEVAQIQFNTQFKAGLNLGLKAFVKYEKEWTYLVGEINPWSFGIALLRAVGPYVGLDVKAGMSIEATGTLLIGASVEWENIDILIDLVNSGNSHTNGLTTVFKHTAEATGKLKMEASLGLLASVGVELKLLPELWEAKGGVVDTPSVVLEGSFEMGATVTDDDPLKSYSIAQGCIGYVNDGTCDDGSDDEGGMSGTGMDCGGSGLFADCVGSQPAPVFDPTSKRKTGKKADTKSTKQKGTAQSNKKPTNTKTKKPIRTSSVLTATTKNTKATQAANKKVNLAKASITSKKASPACNPAAIANIKTPPRSVCKRNVAKARVPSKSIIAMASSVKSVNTCTEICLKSKKCMSFGYGEDKTCQLYRKNFKSLGVTFGRGKQS
ncbi:hypothetical protein BFJ66_g10774 [Fusarium oxysporum f. sp. cepae]|nr:hypothetical protein BFJ66_g10774 [Fusarium oxysporum f. sp. cepae]